jgi:hypothetical protein
MSDLPNLLLKAQQMAATRTRLVAIQKAASHDRSYTFSSRAQRLIIVSSEMMDLGAERSGVGAGSTPCSMQLAQA